MSGFVAAGNTCSSFSSFALRALVGRLHTLMKVFSFIARESEHKSLPKHPDSKTQNMSIEKLFRPRASDSDYCVSVHQCPRVRERWKLPTSTLADSRGMCGHVVAMDYTFQRQQQSWYIPLTCVCVLTIQKHPAGQACPDTDEEQ